MLMIKLHTKQVNIRSNIKMVNTKMANALTQMVMSYKIIMEGHIRLMDNMMMTMKIMIKILRVIQAQPPVAEMAFQ